MKPMGCDCSDCARCNGTVNRLEQRIAELEHTISAHNEEVEAACGKGRGCGYTGYAPRLCQECPKEWLIER